MPEMDHLKSKNQYWLPNLRSWATDGTKRPLLSDSEERNIFLMGPPGAGKTTVAKVLGKLLEKHVMDIDDDWLEIHWKTSVADKLAELGDEGFLEAEGEEMLKFQKKNYVVSLTGSNALHSRSMEHLSKSGIFIYLDVPTSLILSRCKLMKIDRIVGQSTKSLADILAYRQSIYENSYDIRIIVNDGQTQIDIAHVICRELNKLQKYVSTRGFQNENSLEFIDVAKRGLSPDRGLFVPISFSPLSLAELERLSGLSYQEKALRVIERFPLGTLHPSQLRSIIYSAYGTFLHDDVLPVTHLRKNQYLIETYFGPTASFKDLSLQLLPRLLNVVTENDGVRHGLLVATSGDTGTAVLDGFSRLPNSPIVVLYPKDGVSIVQKAQMQTATGPVCVLGVDGDFDFCQTMVKDIFNDSTLNEEFAKIVPYLHFSSANSINWARFLPQVVFTVSSYLKLVEQNIIKLGEPIDVCIPTGNFGNILGAVYARHLGLPLRRLIAASNVNNVIADFVKTGVYDLRTRQFMHTITPSIDILISSNLERFIYLITDSDYTIVKQLFEDLERNHFFKVGPELHSKIQSEISAGWTSEAECLKTIASVYKETGKFIDPHTAVAVHVASSYDDSENVPMLISSTAHYAKFPTAMLTALQEQPTQTTDMNVMFDILRSLPHHPSSNIHPELEKLSLKTCVHTKNVAANKEAIVEEIKQFLKQFSTQIVGKQQL
ncbi:unnamed protein product [Didymodactylos carnosus]|uniref:Threonine synthase N-terminal domain-containing protein n=3 Tax=Didymodactylos carnosus TaxID=1234261 RepID=A0A815ILN2_9BILA|nr:unnamed protein product [Didymodactylos carnosus]CAF4249390.1 unnamed protein product [Didymodactylos carnosus]